MAIFLETERLMMKPSLWEELNDIYAMQSDPDVMKYIGHGVRNFDEVSIGLRNAITHYEKHGFSLCSVFEKKSGLFIGRAGLVHLAYDDSQPEIEVGYHFMKQYWGQGYATEVAKASIAWGFAHLTIDKLVAVINPQNLNSRKVLEKAGMEYVGQTKYLNQIVPKFEILRPAGQIKS